MSVHNVLFFSRHRMLGAAILARAWRGPREPAVTSGEQAFIQEGAVVPSQPFWESGIADSEREEDLRRDHS